MESSKRILVVEDEEKILDVIKAYLQKEEFEVVACTNGEEALNLFKTQVIHLIILDLMLPGISGEDVCVKIRNISDVPVIMLTAKSEEDDKIEGLAIGADDYITKPFSARELIGRVKALIRRAYRDNNPLAEYMIFNDGDLEIEVKKMKVKKQGEFVNLTNHEFKILLALISNPGQVFSRLQLVQQSFGVDYEGFDRAIDSHIKNIRQKIEDNPKKPKYIITVYGAGYKFGGN